MLLLMHAPKHSGAQPWAMATVLNTMATGMGYTAEMEKLGSQAISW